jgi:hypothetical protein
VATLAIVGAFAAIAAGRPVARWVARHPTPSLCVALLDRYAEQEARARDRRPDPTPPPRALDAPEVRSCTRELTLAEVECGLKSGYADELERCLP